MSDKHTDLFGSISIDQQDTVDRTDKAAAPPPPSPPPRRAKRTTRPARKGKPGKADAPRPPTEQRPGRSTLRTVRFWIGILLFVVTAYSGAGFLLAPYLLRTLLPGYVAEQTGTELSFGEIRFNPFTFDLDLDQVAIHGRDGDGTAERLLGIATVRAELAPLSLLRGDLVCGSLLIDRLHLSVIRREDRTYNITPLLRGKAATDQSEIIDFAELTFFFALNNIRISNSRIVIEDRHSGKEHLIDAIELSLPALSNFSYRGRTHLEPRFSAVVNGSPVSLSGETALGSGDPDGDTEISVNLNEIDIPRYSDYLPGEFPIQFTGGTANGTLQISFSEQEGQGNRLIMQFDLSANDLVVRSRDGKLSVRVPSARLDGHFEPLSRSLVIQSMLLREPDIVTSGPVSRETLSALLPMTARPTSDSALYQAIPALGIKLLIADNGSFSRTDPDGKQTLQAWQNLQLSIRNFTNEAPAQGAEAGSFRISGEDAGSSASFTWQGSFGAANQPTGALQLANMPVARIAPFLGRTPNDIAGTVDLNGRLRLGLSEKPDSPLATTLQETSVTIKELQVKERGVVLLRTPSLRCEPVSRRNGVTDFGNVFLPNSTVVMDRRQLPHLFGLFAEKPDQFIIHGFELSGTVKVLDETDAEAVLNLRDVLFQANNLEQKEIKEDNFVFSARQDGGGAIRAKGVLQVAPTRVTGQLTLSDLSPRQMFSWFTAAPTLVDSRALLSAKGTFRYPQQEFTGELAARSVVIGSEQEPVLTAESIELLGFDWSATKRRLEAKEIKVEKPAFPWQRSADAENPAELAGVFLRRMLLPESYSGSAQEGQRQGSEGFSLAVGAIAVHDGAIAYTDRRLVPALQLELREIEGSLRGLAFPAVEQNAVFQLRGAVAEHPFRIEGEGRLLQRPASVTAGFIAPSLPLSLFAEQINERIRDVDFTDATAQVSYSASWQGRNSREQADIVFRGLAPMQPGSPTAITMALVGDGDGQIRYLSDVERSSGTGVVTETITHYATLLIKAAINPLLVVDQTFKDLVEQQYVTFQPGTTILTGAGVERLNRYGELLAAHPLIGLRVLGYADTLADSPVLLDELARQEQQRIDAENRQRADDWRREQEARQAARRQQLEQGVVIQETDLEPDEEFVPLVPEAVVVSDDMLAGLITGREQAVRDYLVEQLSVAAARVTLGGTGEQRVLDDGNGARVDLAISDRFTELAAERREQP